MIVEELKSGNDKFIKGYFAKNLDKLKTLALKGQTPKALFITCSDSRFDPNLISSSELGDLFILRNIGAFIPPYDLDEFFSGTIAVIEYAVLVLNLSNIIICGHSHCGACESLFKDLKDMRYIQKWLNLGMRAKEEVLKNFKDNLSRDELLRQTEKVSVKIQMENILTYPFINNLVEDGKLKLHTMYYDLDTGKINEI